MKKKIYLVVIGILFINLFSGCILLQDRTQEVVPLTKVFIKDYIPNSITIQFINETIISHVTNPNHYWDVYGVGTVEYEGNRVIFRYHIYVEEQNGKLNCVLKELKIGEV